MKEFFKKIGLFFKMIFGKVDKTLIDNIDEAIQVAGFIRSIVSSPILNVVALALPGWATTALTKATQILDAIIPQLSAVEGCTKLATPQERLACFAKYIASLPPLAQNAIIMKIASLYAQLNAGITNNSESDFDTAVQMRYKELKIDKSNGQN